MLQKYLCFRLVSFRLAKAVYVIILPIPVDECGHEVEEQELSQLQPEGGQQRVVCATVGQVSVDTVGGLAGIMTKAESLAPETREIKSHKRATIR